MASDDKIIIEFDGDIKKLKAKLTSTDKQISKLNKVSGGIGRAISASAGVAAIAVGALSASLIGAVNEAKNVESITTQFEVLTGSAQQAKDTVAELQQFAASTPFQFDGIAKASQQLLGFGFQADQLVPKLKQIGDVASAIGKPIEEVGFIFGQVSAAGKLTGERLLQFQERAIPIGPAIAKTLGVAEDAVKDLVSNGEVDFKTFEKAFKSLSEEGGFAFGGMIKQSKTLGGLLSTVSDNVSLLAADMGMQLLPAAKKLAEAFLEILKNLRETDNMFSTTVKYWGKYISESITVGAEKSKKDLKTIQEGIAEAEAEVLAYEKTLKRMEGSWLSEVTGSLASSHAAHAEQMMKLVELKKEEKKLLLEVDQAAANERALIQQEEMAKTTYIKKQELLALAAIEEENAAAIVAKREEALIAEADRRGVALKLLKAFEAEKTKIQIKAINTLNEARLSNDLDKKKKDIANKNQYLKDEAKYGKAYAEMKQMFRSDEYKGTKALLNNLASLSSSSNKTLGRLAQAAGISRAIMNTAQGITEALKLPPPLSYAVAASYAAVGATQIGTISAQKFADGGMFEGGSAGIDSIPALVQQKEIIAPRKNFEEVIGSVRAQREAEKISGGAGAFGGTTEVMISMRDDVGEFIEATILERRELGIGAV